MAQLKESAVVSVTTRQLTLRTRTRLGKTQRQFLTLQQAKTENKKSVMKVHLLQIVSVDSCTHLCEGSGTAEVVVYRQDL